MEKKKNHFVEKEPKYQKLNEFPKVTNEDGQRQSRPGLPDTSRNDVCYLPEA